MPSPNYLYQPIFGVERYVPGLGPDGNGGALVSGSNLIISQWGFVDFDPGAAQPIDYGAGAIDDGFGILVPRYASDLLDPSAKVASDTPMRGRVSARYLMGSLLIVTSPNGNLVVLNPPQELKQQLANSVIFNGGNTFDPANYTFLKPQQGQFSWRFAYYEPDEEPNTFNNSLGDSNIFGQYVPLGTFGGTPDGSYLPLLKTNGADGINPETFDMTTEDGVQECIAAVNKGDFFVPLIQEVLEEAEGLYADIIWPYSASRG